MRNVNNMYQSPFGLLNEVFNESFHKVETIYQNLDALLETQEAIDLGVKEPVKLLITDAGVTLSGVQTVQGVSLSEGHRVAVFNGTTASGIYIVKSGTWWERANDFQEGTSFVVQGTKFDVLEGDYKNNTVYITSPNPINVGSQNILIVPVLFDKQLLGLNNTKGDGSTNDTLAFTNLELDVTGQEVDLQGKVYKVDARPKGNRYYNGSFKVGTKTYTYPRNPYNHLWDTPAPHIKVIQPLRNRYLGLSNIFWYDARTGKMGIMCRDAAGHLDDNGSGISFALSDDGFNRIWANNLTVGTSGGTHPKFKTVFSLPDWDLRNSAGMLLPNGVVASAWATGNQANEYGDAYLIKSTNIDQDEEQNITFTAHTFTSLLGHAPTPTILGFHGKPIVYNNGSEERVAFYCYTLSHGICAYSLPTTGLGSMTEHLTLLNTNPSEGVNVVSEMDVCRNNNKDQYFMLIRNTSDYTFAGFSVSDNPVSGWSAPVLCTLVHGRAPTSIIFWNGSLWAIGVDRRGNKTGANDFQNNLKVSRGNPDVVFATNGQQGWEAWQDVCAISGWFSGYLQHVEVGTKIHSLFTFGENAAGSTKSQQCYLGIISSEPTATPSITSLTPMIPNTNMFPQGAFNHWVLGTSIETGATRKSVMGRMTIARTDGSTGVTCLLGSGERDSTFKMRIRRINGDTNTARSLNVINFSQIDCKPFRERLLKAVTVSFDAKCSPTFSDPNKKITVRARQTNYATEQQITNVSGNYTETGTLLDQVVGTSNSGVKLNEYWSRYQITFDTFAEDMTQFCIQFGAASYVGTADEDFFDIKNMKIEAGVVDTDFQIPLLSEVVRDTERFYNTIPVLLTKETQTIGFPTKMARIPTVSLSNSFGILQGSLNDTSVSFRADPAKITNITDISQATECVVTFSSDIGLSVGDVVDMSDWVGMTQLLRKSYFVVATPSSTSIKISETLGGTPINSSGFSSYTSDGKIFRQDCIITLDANL